MADPEEGPPSGLTPEEQAALSEQERKERPPVIRDDFDNHRLEDHRSVIDNTDGQVDTMLFRLNGEWQVVALGSPEARKAMAKK